MSQLDGELEYLEETLDTLVGWSDMRKHDRPARVRWRKRIQTSVDGDCPPKAGPRPL